MKDSEIDIFYDLVDNCCKRGFFDIVDILLNRDPRNLSTDMILTLLTTTLCAKSKLTCREKFYQLSTKTLPEELLRGLQ